MLRVQVSLIAAFITVLSSVTMVQGWCNETWGCAAEPNTKCQIYQPCKRGDCVCKEGYVLNNTSPNAYCVLAPNKTIGQNCTYDFECMPSNSECSFSTGKCACALNLTASTDNTKCLKNKLGAACYSNSKCGVNAECSNNICRCPNGYKAADDTNCTHYQPGDVCTIDDCDDFGCQGGSCTSGTYQCLPGLKWYVSDRTDQLIDGECVSDMVQIDVGLGYYCGSSSSYFYYCSADATCRSCPEDPNTSRCVSLTGASSFVSSSLLYILSSVILAKYFN